MPAAGVLLQLDMGSSSAVQLTLSHDATVFQLAGCVREVYAEIGPMNLTRPSALQILPGGRTGNNFIQLTHALVHAYYIKVRYIFVPFGFLFILRTIVTTTGVHIIPGASCFANTLAGVFFYSSARCVARRNRWAVETIRPIFWKMWDNYSVLPNVMYLHIRSGDLFRLAQPHPRYGQPPCSYYADAVLMQEISKIVVVTDGGGNPCIALLAHLGADVAEFSLWETLGRLIHARRFALARSTFSLMALALSHFTEIGEFYTCGYPEVLITHHWDCWVSGTYRKQVMLNWTGSERQKIRMKEEECERWRYYG
jgi:hypothetical protein